MWKLLVLCWATIALALTGCRSESYKEADQAILKAEQDKLQGVWKIIACSGNCDGEFDDPVTSYFLLVVDGDVMKTISVSRSGVEDVRSRRKMAIRVGKPLKEIDLTPVEPLSRLTDDLAPAGPESSDQQWKSSRLVGVYKVNRDRLQICLSSDDHFPPTELIETPGSNSYLLTLQRMKDLPREVDPGRGMDTSRSSDR